MAIVKEKMLIQVNATNNNNKFYHVTLSDTGQVAKRYGRVGTDGVTNYENTGESGFNKVVAGKVRKGYKETNVVSVSEEVSVSSNENLSDIAKKVLLGDNGTNSVLEELVDTLVRLNNHDILETSGGLIKVNSSGLITTPLGLIDKQSIAAAKNILSSLERTPVNNTQYLPLLEEYLSLIPQKVGSKRGWYETFFNNENTFASQADFLKQLGESLALREERRKAAIAAEQEASANGDKDAADALEAKYAKLFKLKIDLLEDAKEFKRLETIFEKGKSSYHPGSHLKLKRVFVLNDEEGAERYEVAKKKIGNPNTLWHGTRAGNILSILRMGLYSPPLTGSSIQIQGRLFGPGVYLSPAVLDKIDSKEALKKIVKGGSSKSLNYSLGGVWDRGPREERSFMFLTESVLGRSYNPKTYGLTNNSIHSTGQYDSIYAKASDTGLRNDEVIVWNAEHISMRYLCEFGA